MLKYLVCFSDKLSPYLIGGMPFLSKGQQSQIILAEGGWDMGGSRPTDQCALFSLHLCYSGNEK